MCKWKPKVLADPKECNILQAPKKMLVDDKAPPESMAQASVSGSDSR